MPGTRTAPTVDGAPSGYDLTFRLVDSTRDRRSVTLQTVGDVQPLDAVIEALAEAIQAASNASVYEVQVTARYIGAASAANALTQTYQSVYDNIVVSWKDAANRLQQSTFLPAPLSTIITGADRVDTSVQAYLDYRNAVAAILTAYTPTTARFTERREKNDASPA